MADYHFAPQSYMDPSGQAAGFDIDLAGAVASQIKLKLKVLNIDDPSIIQGLTEQKRRYDMGVNQPPRRHRHRRVGGRAQLLPSGQALLVRSTDKQVKGFDTICGLRVWASPQSEGELAVISVNDKACHDHKARIVSAKDDVDAAQQLAGGKIDAIIDDYPAAVLLARTIKGTRVVPSTSPRRSTWSPPGATALRDAVGKALDRLVQDGTYKKLLDKWGSREGALLEVTG